MEPIGSGHILASLVELTGIAAKYGDGRRATQRAAEEIGFDVAGVGQVALRVHQLGMQGPEAFVTGLLAGYLLKQEEQQHG